MGFYEWPDPRIVQGNLSAFSIGNQTVICVNGEQVGTIEKNHSKIISIEAINTKGQAKIIYKPENT